MNTFVVSHSFPSRNNAQWITVSCIILHTWGIPQTGLLGKQTLIWRLTCNQFITECWWDQSCGRKRKKAGWGRLRSWSAMHSQWRLESAQQGVLKIGSELSWSGVRGLGLYIPELISHWMQGVPGKWWGEVRWGGSLDKAIPEEGWEVKAAAALPAAWGNSTSFSPEGVCV